MPTRACAKPTWGPMSSLLEVDGLSVRYGRVHAVRGASLAVGEGEVVAVLGANGAGKSSLLKGIMELAPVDSGRVRFAERDLGGASTGERIAAGLVLVPEGRRIVMSLSVEENLLMGAYLRHDSAAIKAEIGRMYERFPNLGARRALPASVLSGGEQQMLAIGRGVLARPKLMLLDEPSLGLSPLLVQELFRLLGELNRDGLALLLVEQNTRQALRASARAYVMELGAIVMQDRPQALLDDERLVAAYLGGGNR
jgi:branched-chain amino acid transport system ATP-binding protein